MFDFLAGAGPLTTGYGTPPFNPATSGGWGGLNLPDMRMGQISAPLPNLGGVASSPAGLPFGLNLDTTKLALSGLGTAANLWSAFNMQKLARDQFNFTKQTTQTNMGNQVKSYNTALDDKIRSRAIVEGMSGTEAQAYMDKHKLSMGG